MKGEIMPWFKKRPQWEKNAERNEWLAKHAYESYVENCAYATEAEAEAKELRDCANRMLDIAKQSSKRAKAWREAGGQSETSH